MTKRKNQEKSARDQRRRVLRTWILVGVLIALFAYGIIVLVQRSQQMRLGDHHDIEGREHIRSGESHDAYKTNPPTSGAHGTPMPWGIYAEELVDEKAVHNLEHGGIWISYKDVNDDAIRALEMIARRHPQSVILSPRSANDVAIAVVSWGRSLKLDIVDVAKIEEYIRQNLNKSPERLAR